MFRPVFLVCPSHLELEACSPLCAGLLTQWWLILVILGITAYYFSWRAIHYGLAAFTFGAFFCILSSFPETSHPGTMGIEMYRSSGKVHPKWRPVILNPFGTFTYLRSPNIVAVVRYLLISHPTVTFTDTSRFA